MTTTTTTIQAHRDDCCSNCGETIPETATLCDVCSRPPPPSDEDAEAYRMALAGEPLWQIALKLRGAAVACFTYRRRVRRRRPWLARSRPGAWCACGRRIEHGLDSCPPCVGEAQIRAAIERASR